MNQKLPFRIGTIFAGEIYSIPTNMTEGHNCIEVLWPEETQPYLDLFAILLDKNNNLIEDGDLVFYNSCHTMPNSKIPSSIDGSVYDIGDPLDDEDGYWGEGKFIDLYKTRPQINKIIFFLAAYDMDGRQTLKGIKDIKIRFRSQDSKEILYETHLEESFEKEKVVQLCSLSKNEEGQWHIRVDDIGYSGNLPSFIDRFIPDVHQV